MLKKELAQALGISAAMVSKLAKRGMPTDTVERAQRWRKRHLEPGRLKGQRLGTTAPPETRATSHRATDPAQTVELLMRAAGTVLEAGADLSPLLPDLRAAMRAVPPSPARDAIPVHPGVMELLLGRDFLAEHRTWQQENPSDAPMTDEEAIESGRFLYSLAAGEFLILPKGGTTPADEAVLYAPDLDYPEGPDSLP